MDETEGTLLLTERAFHSACERLLNTPTTGPAANTATAFAPLAEVLCGPSRSTRAMKRRTVSATCEGGMPTLMGSCGTECGLLGTARATSDSSQSNVSQGLSWANSCSGFPG
jgi:hypothetical protein